MNNFMILAEAEVVEGGDLGNEPATTTQTIQADPNQTLPPPPKKERSHVYFYFNGPYVRNILFYDLPRPEEKAAAAKKDDPVAGKECPRPDHRRDSGNDS